MQNATGRAAIVLGLLLLLWPIVSAGAGQSIVHVVQPGDNLIRICGLYREQTGHYSLTDLLTAIRRANGLESNFLHVGRRLEIPVLEREEVRAVTRRVRDGAEMRGIYLTGPACGVSSVLQRVDTFIAAGGNAVVFDAKDIDGGVSFGSRHPLASWGRGRSNPVISSLDDMMGRFERRGLYVVARLALFLDGELGVRRPDLALQHEDGSPWSERGCVWMDPGRAEVREYNLSLAAELARAGVDEVQFDYVRYPTNGWDGDAGPAADIAAIAERRRATLELFLAAARDTLDRYGVRISADLYGIMAWGRIEDQAVTGQHVPTIARHVDVICPMIYPSHFGAGFEGRRRPADDPEYFVEEGTRRFLALVPADVEIRPWLQAFPFGVTDYGPAYVATQVEAARSAGGRGWCLWNPACRYAPVLSAWNEPPHEASSGPVLAERADRTSGSESPSAEAQVPSQGAPATLGALGGFGPVTGGGVQPPQP